MSACLGCKHWKPILPAGLKIEGELDWWGATQYMKAGRGWVSGNCTVEPTWLDVRADHFCGRFVGDDKSFDVMVFGTWTQRSNEDLVAKNKKLTHQLKEARRISAGRLAKLQKSPNNPK